MSNPRLPRAIWVLGFVSLSMDVSSELIQSLLPVFLLTSLAASASVIGLIDGIAEATAMVVKVFSGALSDYWGRRKPLAAFGYGLGAISKPLFAIATSSGSVLGARVIDRIGKGIRGAPRDALVADIAPAGLRGAAFGLRQALDTVGAFLGPALALLLMLLWDNDFRAVFWVAVVPGFMAVMLMVLGVREPEKERPSNATNPVRRENLGRLSRAYWWVVTVGAVFTLARFSEAFLILRAEQAGLRLALVPLVLMVMNLAYSLSAYPFGKLSDTVSHDKLLALGLGVLLAADLVLAFGDQLAWVWVGILLWGLHMGMTQGLLATMVAETAPADLRGTAYGFFNLVSGVALLFASTLAGVLWDRFGAEHTFLAGAIVTGAALSLLAIRRVVSAAGSSS